MTDNGYSQPRRPREQTGAQIQARIALDTGKGRESLRTPKARVEYDRLVKRQAQARIGVPDRPAVRHAAPDGYAVASLVLSIVWMGGLGSLLAVIFAHTSSGAAKRQGEVPSSMSVWGMALGYVGLLIAVIAGIALGVAVAHSQPPACTPSSPNWPYC